MSSEWTKVLDQGKRTCLLSLDTEGAFDRVWHRGLLEKLRGLGIVGKVHALLINFLRYRRLNVMNGRESSEYKINDGVPHGSVQGPLLWKIILNDLLHLIPEARAFADDGMLTISYDPGQEKALASRHHSLAGQIRPSKNTIVEYNHKWCNTPIRVRTTNFTVSR